MQIKIDLKIFIFVLFFFILGEQNLYLLFLIYTIIHELAHMITGIVLGMKPSVLSIMPFGASISFKPDINSYNQKIGKGNVNNIKKWLIATAGPISNIIIVLIFAYKSKYILITYINTILAIFNLLPIYPLDGGRVIKETLTIICGRRKALKYTNIISNTSLIIITVCSIMFCYINRSILLLISIIYLVCIRKRENEIYIMRERIYQILEEPKDFIM